jgi:hypothetical protein
MRCASSWRAGTVSQPYFSSPLTFIARAIPVVLTGDFNSKPLSRVYALLASQGRGVAACPPPPNLIRRESKHSPIPPRSAAQNDGFLDMEADEEKDEPPAVAAEVSAIANRMALSSSSQVPTAPWPLQSAYTAGGRSVRRLLLRLQILLTAVMNRSLLGQTLLWDSKVYPQALSLVC